MRAAVIPVGSLQLFTGFGGAGPQGVCAHVCVRVVCVYGCLCVYAYVSVCMHGVCVCMYACVHA